MLIFIIIEKVSKHIDLGGKSLLHPSAQRDPILLQQYGSYNFICPKPDSSDNAPIFTTILNSVLSASSKWGSGSTEGHERAEIGTPLSNQVCTPEICVLLKG